MNLNEFAVLVAKKEGKKKEVSIAQIKEIMKIINTELKGIVYGGIRLK